MCRKEKARTKIGKIEQLYFTQRATSKYRKLAPPTYTKNSFIRWCWKQPLFHELHKAWELSMYNKWEAPSCDRIDDYKPYTLDNIQLMSWQENNNKGKNDRKSGKNNKASRAVLQLSLHSGVVLNEYYSTREAERQTGISQSHISKCANNKLNSIGGFNWEFK